MLARNVPLRRRGEFLRKRQPGRFRGDVPTLEPQDVWKASFMRLDGIEEKLNTSPASPLSALERDCEKSQADASCAHKFADRSAVGRERDHKIAAG